MLVYTYYTTETTRPTAKLTSRNFRQVFENDSVLVKIKPITIHRNNANIDDFYNANITSILKSENSRLFTLLAPLQLYERVHTLETGEYSYLLFEKCRQADGRYSYKYSLTLGIDIQPALLARHNRVRARVLVEQDADDEEVPEPIVQEVPPRRRNNTPARVEQVVPAKPKAIKFTMNTECYICMMDFSEDPDVTINSCCMKLAHTACYSGIVQKSSCACCRTTLE